MIRLGLRLTLGGGREAAARLVVTAIAVALGVGMLLAALACLNALNAQNGRAKWLEPYTIKTMKTLAKKGVKNLVVITPGFSADCLETLEEIAVENAHVFKRYGGENFAAIPCLNDSEAGMLMIWQLAMRELKGWT